MRKKARIASNLRAKAGVPPAENDDFTLWCRKSTARYIVRTEGISLVNPASAGGSSRYRLSPREHVPRPHHATASGDQSAERTCHRARHRQTPAPWMDQPAQAHA